MGVIKDKLNEQIQNNDLNKYDSTIAVIKSFNNITNTASIYFNNPNGGQQHTATNVAFKINSGGVNTAPPVAGQKCWIEFLHGNLLTPVITSLCDDKYFENVYSKRTNSDSGAFLCSVEVLNTDTDIKNKTPMIDNYKSKINKEWYEKFINTSLTSDTRKIIIESDKYKDTEDGITNLNTNSTIKIDEDGNINIFVGNNTGLKIDTYNQSVDIYGTLTVNGIKVNNNKDNEEKDITVTMISDIIKLENTFKEFDIEEFIEIINNLIKINGNSNKYTLLLQRAEEYKSNKEKWERKEIDIKTLKDFNEKIIFLISVFNKELDQCNNINFKQF